MKVPGLTGMEPDMECRWAGRSALGRQLTWEMAVGDDQTFPIP